MKVAMITHHWKESDGGGIRTYVVNLVDALRGRGADVGVLFRDGVDAQEFKARKGLVGFTLDCCRQLRRTRPEVVHSHNTWHCLLPGVIYKAMNRTRLVHTLHTEPGERLSFPTRAFYRLLLNSCDRVVFSSKGLEEKVAEVHGIAPERSAVIYGGARAEAVTSEEVNEFKSKFDLDGAFPIILVQAFTEFPLKAEGLKLTIEAVKVLREKYPTAKLVATRDGRFTGELRRFADAKGVSDRVVFTGDVGNAFVPLVISDVFVFPWLGQSGVGLALLEAMVVEKAVVVTDAGHGSEVVRDHENGLFAAPEPSSIANAVDLMVRDRRMALELGRRAKRTVDSEFSWERAAERYLRCYASEA